MHRAGYRRGDEGAAQLMRSSHKFQRRELQDREVQVKGRVTEVSNGHFKVKTQSPNKSYNVAWIAERWVCTCADFSRKLSVCGHILAVQRMQAYRANLKSTRRAASGRSKS